MDRRQRKSRAALESALTELVRAKPYAEITIEDVTSTADVARATFYAHFKDKQALLRQITEDLSADLVQTVDELGPRSGVYTGGGVGAIFHHAHLHRDVYRLILSGDGGAECRDELIHALEHVTTTVFTRMAEAAGRPARAPLTIATLGIVGAMVLTLDRWLRGDIAGEPDELSLAFVHTQMNGIGWALGFEPSEIQYRPGPVPKA